MKRIRPDEGERLPGDETGLGITRPEWHALLDDLLELNRHGRLGGIIAIVHEAQRQAQDGYEPVNLAAEVAFRLSIRDFSATAALLAAEIDRQANIVDADIWCGWPGECANGPGEHLWTESCEKR